MGSHVASLCDTVPDTAILGICMHKGKRCGPKPCQTQKIAPGTVASVLKTQQCRLLRKVLQCVHSCPFKTLAAILIYIKLTQTHLSAVVNSCCSAVVCSINSVMTPCFPAT